MRILLVTETLHAGGAETFVVRLANALSRHHQVMIVNLYPELSRPQLMAQLQPAITLVNVSVRAKGLINKIDSLFYHARIDISILRQIFIKEIATLIEKWKPDVVHSHLFKPDYYVAKAKQRTTHNVVHAITNHGDYLLFDQQAPVKLLNYEKKLAYALNAINQLVVISDEQVRWAETKKQQGGFSFGIRKIINGYELPEQLENIGVIKNALQLSESDFVFGMVARGVKEKGWENLIQAFLKLPFTNIKLVLIGAGDEIDKLKMQYKPYTRIIFTGYISDPISYVQVFNVGMLPSHIENLPTVIIEYLACGKPVIATQVGEVKKMITTSADELAGTLVGLTSTGADENALAQAMSALYNNGENIDYKRRAKEAFQKFDMNKCITAYLEVYKR